MVYKYTFKHFMDISTSAASVQIIKIKAGGEYVHQRCKHLFGVFKYFKLGAVKVKLVPASTLPVDPLGLAYGNTEPQTVDPRDQMNPGLVRITNGETVMTNLSGISGDVQMAMYLNTMLDPRWSKFMLQQGFKRSAVPLAYEVGNLKQTAYPDAVENIPITTNVGSGDNVWGTRRVLKYNGSDPSSYEQKQSVRNGSDGRGLFQLGHTKRIGWLPVDNMEQFAANDSGSGNRLFNAPELTPVPSVDCITVILPKAYKTLYYYRLFISETVYFDGVKNVGNYVSTDQTNFEYRSFDNFTLVENPSSMKPNAPYLAPAVIDNPNDGGASNNV